MPYLRVTPRGLLAALLALVVAATCVRLGFWQLDRLEGRRARNAALRAAGALPPLVLDSATMAAVADSPAAYVNRRVRLRGAYDPAGEVVLRGRAREGRPGVHLVTPLRVEGGAAVLVNRGWAPSPDGATVDRAPLAEPGPHEVVGLLQEIPVTEDRGQPAAAPGRDTTFRRLDLAAVRARAPYPVLPLYVQQLPDSAAPRDRPPFRVPPPELGEGNHLSYAIQWFSFAAIAVIGMLAVALRRKR
ncbi:MAG TPA: SURF1 family protein [Longimicrobiaceae bacterium]|jgi:surfeit locus 1 family protein